MRLTSILTTEGATPHWSWRQRSNLPGNVTPDSQKLEVYVREVIQVVSNVLILTNKEPRQMCIWWDMRARIFKIWMNKRSCYLEVISRKVRD